MFKGVPVAYNDPFWVKKASDTENKLGLPDGLLQSVLMHGERSNADAVSSAGARTPFQITPQTRKLIKNKYQIDPYESPDAAAESAGLLLKESLDRNQGDKSLAVAEYHGGTNPKNWGKITQSYVERVAEGFRKRMNQMAFVEQEEALVETTEPDKEVLLKELEKTYADYISGKMPKYEALEYEDLLATGQIVLPKHLQNQIPQDTSKTTASGVMGAATRGLAPVTMGALAGGALGLAGGPASPITVPAGAAAGAAAMGLTQLVGDPAVRLVNKYAGTNITPPTETIQNALTSMGVEKPDTPTERVVEMGASGLGGAGTGVAAGQVMQQAASPVTRAIGQTLASQPKTQAISGGLSGAAGQATAEAGGGPFAQFAASLLAGAVPFSANRVQSAVKTPIVDAPEVQAAKQAGIDVMTSDVAPPTTYIGKSARAMGEQIPIVGTGAVRATQQEQRIQAIKDIAADYGHDENAFRYVARDALDKHAADLGKYSTLKKEVIERLSGGVVPTDRTIKTIDDAVTRLASQNNVELKPAIQKLLNFREAFKNQNLVNIEESRKALGEALSDPAITHIKTPLQKSANKIYGALQEDMGDYIAKVGEKRDVTKWKLANTRLKSMIGDLDKSSFKNALNKGDLTPESIGNLIFSKNKTDVEMLYKNLTPQGRASAKMAIMHRAIEKSGGMDHVSPERFISEVKRLGNSTGVFFTGDDGKRLEGLTRALQLTSRAGEAAVNTSTGGRLFLPSITAGFSAILGGSIAGTAASLATVGGLARIYESPAVRNILVKLAQSKQGSQSEANLAKQLTIAIREAAQRQEKDIQNAQD